MQRLLNYIHSLTDFSEKSWEVLLPVLTRREFRKDDFLLKENEVCHSLFFIEQGYCKSYYDKDGVEKNTAFCFEGEVATNINSFASGERSTYNIQACEPLTTVVFDRQKLFEAAAQWPEIETLGRKCLRLTASRLEEHANIFKLYTTQERYEYLEQNQPHLLQRVSLTDLSSYLGIARETLSRVRKRRL
ncbi:Crp/Fnr family transcriptional regulator [Chitinophaga tropicalis]|uniref:Cyclic nucleotide-binding domain-containing protein n=1 Tax=Chitinophaga tropicalis TaxID=2683588 RepID=A0A7K1TXA7_9BACT|nr:Crp/Fnr family transcriptional regulator [Chitinophaga tropicalis]MVT06739.1 cyclic nucleotide-binding domain-containing protein [Chitinophaga tropicalis]